MNTACSAATIKALSLAWEEVRPAAANASQPMAIRMASPAALRSVSRERAYNGWRWKI